ncbi:MAG: 50S ribosomal protein L28 [Firmicutes bacterium]|nr:50S ribosomal protein L28 [Bacillota bacterium]
MSKECIMCGKSRASGNNVSHSNRKTRRTFGANIHKANVEIDGVVRREKVCTRCMRTAKKTV